MESVVAAARMKKTFPIFQQGQQKKHGCAINAVEQFAVTELDMSTTPPFRKGYYQQKR